jgi:hypothetical protein
MSEKKEWIIQDYKEPIGWLDVGSRSDLLTRNKMISMLKRFEQKYPEREFRGHNVANERDEKK